MGELKILFKNVEDGLIHGEVVVGSASFCFTVGHKHAPIDDLLRTVLDLHEAMASGGVAKEAEGMFFSFWEDGKSQYAWKFTPKGDSTVRVEFSFCEDMAAGIHTRTDMELDETIDLKLLLENLFTELRGMLIKWGFTGYKNRMLSREFPVADFLKLGAILGKTTLAGSLADEMEVLKKVVNPCYKEIWGIDRR